MESNKQNKEKEFPTLEESIIFLCSEVLLNKKKDKRIKPEFHFSHVQFLQ